MHCVTYEAGVYTRCWYDVTLASVALNRFMWLSRIFSLAQSPVVTSFPPQSCAAASQRTQDHSATTVLPYTNRVAHILTQKTYIANHNKICHKTTQKDIVDGSISSM
jgi:hypothetical protein